MGKRRERRWRRRRNLSRRRMNSRSSSMNRKLFKQKMLTQFLQRNKSRSCMFPSNLTSMEFFRLAFKDFPYIKCLGNTVIYRSLAKEVSAVEWGRGKESGKYWRGRTKVQEREDKVNERDDYEVQERED